MPVRRLRSLGTLSPLDGLLVFALGGVLGGLLRRGLIEPEAIGVICESAPPWWCAARLAIIHATALHLFGGGALAFAAVSASLAARFHRPAALLALGLGGVGAVLYDATPAAAAVVIALLVLVVRREAPAGGKSGPEARRHAGVAPLR